MPALTTQDLLSSYLHIRDGGQTDVIPVSDSFWEELVIGLHPQLDQGRLLSAFTFSQSWPMWERHPAGDELVLLLSGAATIVIEESGLEHPMPLSSPGQYVLVPKGIWHTAKTSVPTTMLFLTVGAGTEHRPIDA